MKRVLVVLPNWFGETLFATPFLRALREQKPELFLAVLGHPQTHEVLLGNPFVDVLLVLDEKGYHRSLIGKWRLIRQLREHKFDSVFILRKSLSRTFLMACAGIPTRIGFSNGKSGWLLNWCVKPPQGRMHKSRTYQPLLEAVGLAAARSHTYDYTVTELERIQAADLLNQHRLQPGFALLHIGANWFHKRWPLERFARLADELIEKQNLQVAITGGPNEAKDAEATQQSMRNPVVILAGKTSLRQLAACCEQAGVIVANDTGVLHIAAALKKPVVALFGPTDPAITGPLGVSSKTIVIHHPDSCPKIPCYEPNTPPHAGMARISVDEVYGAALKLLDRKA